MEQKHIVLSALSVGVGVGIGLASGKTVSKWRGDAASASKGINSETMEQELLKQVIDGRESGVTFDQFPYYLRSVPPLSSPSLSQSSVRISCIPFKKNFCLVFRLVRYIKVCFFVGTVILSLLSKFLFGIFNILYSLFKGEYDLDQQ
jgi:hypothetical protein